MRKKSNIDQNGFETFRDCKFFCECVSQYLGSEIDPEGKMGLKPKGIYNVYRPKSEVSKREFIESLNAKPLLDDHEVIGNFKGATDPDKANTSGTLTEVKLVGNELHGRIDVWSPKMLKKIHGGKRELSLSYSCEFVPRKGVYNGERYDFVQSNLRCGNHLALVDTARNGHDCRVMDGAIVHDETIQMEKPEMDISKLSADEVVEALKGCSDEVKAKCKDFLNAPAEKEESGKEEPKAEDKADEKAEEPKAEDKAEEPKKEEPKPEDKPADDKCADKPEDKPAEDKAKAEEETQKACDAAIEEYKRAMSLAEDCKPVFGTISMDGIKSEKDLAVKVLALDAAPKSLKNYKPEEAIVALRAYLAASGTPKQTIATDSGVVGKKSWSQYRASR